MESKIFVEELSKVFVPYFSEIILHLKRLTEGSKSFALNNATRVKEGNEDEIKNKYQVFSNNKLVSQDNSTSRGKKRKVEQFGQIEVIDNDSNNNNNSDDDDDDSDQGGSNELRDGSNQKICVRIEEMKLESKRLVSLNEPFQIEFDYLVLGKNLSFSNRQFKSRKKLQACVADLLTEKYPEGIYFPSFRNQRELLSFRLIIGDLIRSWLYNV